MVLDPVDEEEQGRQKWEEKEQDEERDQDAGLEEKHDTMVSVLSCKSHCALMVMYARTYWCLTVNQ